MPMIKLMVKTRANHSGSNPSFMIMGMKMGRQIIVMATVSINIPIINTITIIIVRMPVGLTDVASKYSPRKRVIPN